MSETFTYHEVYMRMHQERKLWFDPMDPCLKELSNLISNSTKEIVIQWSLLQVKRIISIIMQKYPNENRPVLAYERSIQWLHKEIKMLFAKRAILDCHAAAKEYPSSSDQTLFHAVGQGLSTIHVKTHAMGIAVYELTSIARDHIDDLEPYINQKIKEYLKDFYSSNE